MILSCQGISKSFGEKVILEDASFHIEEREKAALIGNNGAGKTTLLRIIMEEIHADAGQVVLAKDKRIGYLAQYQDVQGHLSVYEELLSTKQYIIDMEERLRAMEVQMKNASGEELDRLMNSYTRLTHEFELENGYAYKSELMGVLNGLGFTEEDFTKQVATLSGGQKTRVALGKLLISKPDILLLDEPTTTWIWKALPGWKLIFSIILVLFSLYLMTAIFWTKLSQKSSRSMPDRFVCMPVITPLMQRKKHSFVMPSTRHISTSSARSSIRKPLSSS